MTDFFPLMEAYLVVEVPSLWRFPHDGGFPHEGFPDDGASPYQFPPQWLFTHPCTLSP